MAETIANFIKKHTIIIFFSGWGVMIGNLALLWAFIPRCPSGQADFFWYFCGLTLMMIGLMMVIVPLMMFPSGVAPPKEK